MSSAVVPSSTSKVRGFAAASGGSAGDDDDHNNPSRKRNLPNAHGIDDDGSGAHEPFKCEVCGRRFEKPKALHGHMRTHPERKWRGVLPPAMCPRAEKEMAEFLIDFSGRGETSPELQIFQCTACLKDFPSKYALGGHRASHKNHPGCCAKAKKSLVPHSAGGGSRHKRSAAARKWLKTSGSAKKMTSASSGNAPAPATVPACQRGGDRRRNLKLPSDEAYNDGHENVEGDDIV